MESGGVFFWSGQEGGKLTKLTSKKKYIKKNNKTTKQQSKKQDKTNKQKGFKPLGSFYFIC